MKMAIEITKSRKVMCALYVFSTSEAFAPRAYLTFYFSLFLRMHFLDSPCSPPLAQAANELFLPHQTGARNVGGGEHQGG